MPSLSRSEARLRADLISVTSVQVDLDLDEGEDTFTSRTRIRFTCREPGASTFLDLDPVEVASLTLNGAALDPSAVADGRVALTGLAAENTVEAVATMRYSRDGQGLHRAVDPADGERYVYGHLFLDAAPSVFACFDQPDLKAPYAVSVTAPPRWQVLGNGAATQVGPGRWELAETKPLATYFVTVCAGPFASVRTEHDGIPLGVHARASLREPLERQAPQMLEVTRASFDYYHQLFGIRYPFGEYHQVFVPEFNAGAMENPGCVTLRDTYVFRGAAARDEVLTRSNTIAHELAHMWFGDLVTMRWWDDLWLNESFAEYMAHRTCVAATEFTEGWVDSTVARKMWGYAAERTPSTHPVAGGEALDTQAALQDFDGISYAKGAATLRQLIAHIGDEAFIAGVGAYLREHAFGNGTLADFLGFMERASGKDLSGWSRSWLLTAGLDVIAADQKTGVVTREVPQDYPAARPHTLDVAGFSGAEEVFRVAVTLDGDATDAPSLAAAPAARIVVPNASDLTWATVALDADTLAAVPAGLAQVPDPQARAVVWAALVDGVCLGTVDPRLVVDTLGMAWPLESNESVLNRIAVAVLGRIIPTLPAAGRAGRRQGRRGRGSARPARAQRARLDHRRPGREDPRPQQCRRVPAVALGRAPARCRPVCRRTRTSGGWWSATSPGEGSSTPTSSSRSAARTTRWPAGSARCLRARRASRCRREGLGMEGADDEPRALQLRAQRPGGGVLVRGRPRRAPQATCRATSPSLPPLSEWVGADALGRVAALAFPARVVEQPTADASAAALAADALSPAVRRSIVDGDSELREALRSRAVFDA